MLYINNKMKTSCKCKIEKNKIEFSKNQSQKDGLNNICKSCKKEYNNKNKQHNTEVNNQWRLNNLEKKKTNFFDCVKKIINNCINITSDNMYNGLIKKFKIFDK